MADEKDPRMKLLKENIKPYPDFPKKGIVFQDIFGAMRKTSVLKSLMELVQEYAKKLRGSVDCVVGLDSRGFLFGPIMALELEVPFVPVLDFSMIKGFFFSKYLIEGNYSYNCGVPLFLPTDSHPYLKLHVHVL